MSAAQSRWNNKIFAGNSVFAPASVSDLRAGRISGRKNRKLAAAGRSLRQNAQSVVKQCFRVPRSSFVALRFVASPLIIEQKQGIAKIGRLMASFATVRLSERALRLQDSRADDAGQAGPRPLLCDLAKTNMRRACVRPSFQIGSRSSIDIEPRSLLACTSKIELSSPKHGGGGVRLPLGCKKRREKPLISAVLRALLAQKWGQGSKEGTFLVITCVLLWVVLSARYVNA